MASNKKKPSKPKREDIPRFQRYLNMVKAMSDDWSDYFTHCREISQFSMPHRGRFVFLGEDPRYGVKKMDKIADNTAERAINILQAGMHGGLTSPSRPWFRLKPSNVLLMESGGVRFWLDTVQRIMYSAFRRSNFYQATHLMYGEQAGFGMACILEEEDVLEGMRFYNFTSGEFLCSEGPDGRINRIVRKFRMTAEQMVTRFGYENCSQTVMDAYDKTGSMNKPFDVLLIIEPNDERDVMKADAKNMPFRAVYLEAEHKDRDKGKLLGESGFKQFPAFVPRWQKISTDPTGYGPGMSTLPDVKMLQDISWDLVEALHKKMDPPIQVPIGQRSTINRLPGGVSFYDPNTSSHGIKSLYERLDFETEAAARKIGDLQRAVKEGFFNDLFLMISNLPSVQPRTATEIAERHEEKLIMLGPVIERNIQEFLDPCMDRTFDILLQNGAFPPPPPELAGQDLKVEYISTLAKAQEYVSALAIQSTVELNMALMQANPDVADKVDYDQVMDEFADITGTPWSIIRPDDVVAEMREIRAQIRAQQEQAEGLAQMAEGAKTLSETDTEGKNALTDLTGAAAA